MEQRAKPDSQPDDADRVLDVQGLICPMPVLRAKVALAEMQSEQTLRVLATDPHSVMDFRAFCDKTGHRLLACDDSGGVFEFLIRKC